MGGPPPTPSWAPIGSRRSNLLALFSEAFLFSAHLWQPLLPATVFLRRPLAHPHPPTHTHPLTLYHAHLLAQVSDDGACYKGAVDLDGKKMGEGTYMWADGSMYAGQWKRNRFHGIGTLSYADGGEYQGEWRNDRKHGHGRMCFPNSDVFEGDWKDGVMHG